MSLFCFCIMQVQGYERDVLATQARLHSGIFGCEDQMVFSDQAMRIDGGFTTTPIGAVASQLGGQGPMATGSWVNTQVFFRAWGQLRASGKYRGHDFVVKVDPDTVLLPDILKQHLQQLGAAANPRPVYFLNCPNVDNGFYGAIEVFSAAAFQGFMDSMDTCRTELSYQGWGEDLFCQKCMDSIGMQAQGDYQLVADGNCHGPGAPPGCMPGKPAYHPFKSPQAWETCFMQATSSAEVQGGVAAAPGLVHQQPMRGQLPMRKHRFPVEELAKPPPQQGGGGGLLSGLPSFHRLQK